MKIKTIKKHKSIPEGLEFEFPDLTIITGKNGSGKSHLLEAINNKLAHVLEEGVSLDKITYIPFGGLNPQISEQGSQQEIINNLKACWQNIQNTQNYVRNGVTNNNWSLEQATQIGLNQNKAIARATESLLTKTRKKSILDITEDDVIKYVKLSELTENGLFFSQFAQIFKSYNIRMQKNEFNEFLSKEKGKTCEYLTAEEFEKEYGPKPWNLVNDILKNAGLTYQVTDPDGVDIDADFILRLVDAERGLEISVNDLSTGERVLMSLALAIYNSSEGGARPDILLIDEPDAALHPHFSKVLINTIKKSIVDIAKTKVILTTHSPATVAMCPNNSVYQIDKDTKTPKMISIAEALNILTEGIPHLKVSMESRLQVFVESKYDVTYYERIHNLLRRTYNYLKSPIFLEPHSGTSNCSDVINIAGKFHEHGNDLVRGIIDSDGSNKSEHPVYVLGNGNRYSVENYILDPIYISLALIRAGKKNFSDFGVTSIESYVSAGALSNLETQMIADYVLTKLGIVNSEKVTFELENEYSISYPKDFLAMRGHDYEKALLEQLPELNALKKDRTDAGLKLGVMQVIEEFPQFLSKDWNSTFLSVLS
jgi:predicted ATPase